MAEGALRIHLGAAPGAGKTCALLAEGHRLLEDGVDVVVAAVDARGRRGTAALVEGLPLVAREGDPAGLDVAGLDVAAVLRRRPAVALVDDLARADPGAAGRPERWQDVQELLAAGIDVVSTVGVEELESLADVVERVTGRRVVAPVPDAVVRAAERVELVDVAPEVLQQRLAHDRRAAPEGGGVLADAVPAGAYRLGDLMALRELALLWLADRVDDALRASRDEHGSAGLWEARERVVVALPGGPAGEALVRRAARVAARGAADLLAVHVSPPGDLTAADPGALATQRALAESLGGTYHELVGTDVARVLLDFAEAEAATQLVLGGAGRSRLAVLLRGPGVTARTIRSSGPVDVHVVSTDGSAGRSSRLPRPARGLGPRRRLQGAVLAGVVLPVLTLLLADTRQHVDLASQLLGYLLAVVAVALVGGLWPALAAAVTATGLANWFFTPPVHTWAVAEGDDVLALAAFVVVAVAVSSAVDRAAARTRLAARASAESRTLSALASSVLQGADALPALLHQAQETFGMTSVGLLEQEGDGWRVVAAAGSPPPRTPGDADATAPAGPGLLLALRGRELAEQDRRVLVAFAAQAATAVAQARLARAAEAIAPLERADRMRTALLAAVSHDLRAPLAAAKAAVTSLSAADVTWSPSERGELLATAEQSLDRLTRLVENLLDMSRLQAGALSVFPRPVAAEEVVIATLGDDPARRVVALDVPDGLPEVVADPALLDRVVANLVDNALRHSPPQSPPRVVVGARAGRVEIAVVDRGPGIPAPSRERVFTPFQRLGDTDTSTGVGLGLALSRGLTEAMSGTLRAGDTPGGGLTMTVSLPAAVAVEPPAAGVRERRSSATAGREGPA